MKPSLAFNFIFRRRYCNSFRISVMEYPCEIKYDSSFALPIPITAPSWVTEKKKDWIVKEITPVFITNSKFKGNALMIYLGV